MEFLLKMIEEQYGNKIANEIIEGYKKQRAVTFRVNTLKSDIKTIQNKLEEEKIEYEKTPWSEEAFIIKNANEKIIRELDMYKNGEIYLQSLSSMLPPIILKPQEGADILDMAAAPGGKTTQIAALSKNKAHITACEKNKIRAERLKYNVDKQGANVFIMTKDARYIDDFFSFDQILLDAPCSGSGTININNNNSKNIFTQKLIERSISLQLALLKKAIKILKPGKEMVYSTCSILSCENEEILKKVLSNEKAEIIPIDFKGIEHIPVLPTKIEGTLNVCPNELYEGFFVAKIRKK
mgnify:CR=1 FL=1